MVEIIGIDAGGSKTRVLHASVPGTIRRFKVIKEAYLDSYNYRQDGISGLNRLIKQILGNLNIRDLEATLVLCGVAGAGTDRSHKSIQGTFEKHGFRRNLISIISDADLLLVAIGNEGIVLTAGTGSVCVGRRKVSSEDGGEINVRAGGYGFRMYSEPGGFQLGMRALDAALRIEDGRGRDPTVLCTSITNYFGVSHLENIIQLIYPRAAKTGNINRQIAGTAKLVLEAAHDGDKTANHLVTELIDNFADHILAVYSKLGLENPLVGLHGGLFADRYGEELLITPLTQHPLLKAYDLRFTTLGTRKSDTDPLIEAMKWQVFRKRQ